MGGIGWDGMVWGGIGTGGGMQITEMQMHQLLLMDATRCECVCAADKLQLLHMEEFERQKSCFHFPATRESRASG